MFTVLGVRDEIYLLLLLDVGGLLCPVSQSVPKSAGDSEPTISCKKDSAKQSLQLAAYISLILNNML